MGCVGVGETTHATSSRVPGTEDLPLAPSLVVAHEDSVVFESLTGRIVTIKAHTSKDPTIIQRFYEQTLPNLGWKKIGVGSYEREHECLKIECTQGTKGTDVTFTLTTP